jgi:hypothetical protein
MIRRIAMLSVLAGALALPVMVKAQDQGAQPGGNQQGADRNRGGDRGNRGGFDPAAMRERFEGMLKEQLGNPTEDEWKVIQPKLDKVMQIQRDSRGGIGSMFGSRSRGGDNNNNQPQSDVQKAQAALKETLDKKDASVEDINAKLAALRSAREKSKAELKSAQKDLTDVLTSRQVATLVMFGMLD